MNASKSASAERQAHLLHAAAQATKSLTTILDPDELFQRVSDIICDEYRFYYAGVFLLDDEGEYAVLRAGRGEAGTAMVAEEHKLKVGGNSMIGAATAHREARIALDVGEEAAFFKNPHLPETRSEMALPLSVGEDVIGALTVQSTDESAFTEDDISSLQSMADQLAIAIQNARLHRQNQDLLRRMERRARLLEASHQVGHEVSTILNLDEILEKTVDIICDAYGFYYAGIFLLDEKGEWAVLRAGRAEAGAAMVAEGHTLKVGSVSMIGAATSLREARIALDVGEEAVFFKNPHLPHTRSEMALPLVVGDEVLGALTIQSVEESAFSEYDITSLQAMADHLAIALHNANILVELNTANAELMRTKTYEALATAITQAIHWIGNKTLPITTAIARLQFELEMDEIDKESFAEDLEIIEQSANLIVQVKENLLGPAREQRPRPAMLGDMLKAAAFYNDISPEVINIKVAPNTPQVLADTTQLIRALGNLLTNAIEAKARNINVEIRPAKESGQVEIIISDNGGGIPADVIDKVWASFFTTKGPSHNGLGLAACLHVITQHDGRITVDSAAGRGARFTILLPVCPRIPEGDLSKSPSRILLIDDDDEWAAFIVDSLTRAGKIVTHQTTIHKTEDADLILLDETLVAGPLAPIIEAIREIGAADKTIVVTPAMRVENATYYMQCGVKDVVPKPYSTAELAAVLS